MGFFEETASLLGQFVHAEPGSIVMHQNVSALFNAALSCFDFSGSRNKILYPELTFPTLRYNIQTRARLGAQPLEIASPDGIRQPVERFIDAIDNTIFISHRNRIETILEQATDAEVRIPSFIWRGAQYHYFILRHSRGLFQKFRQGP